MGKPAHTAESVQALLDEKKPGAFQMLDFRGYKTASLVRCGGCSREFFTAPRDLLRRMRCSGCSEKRGASRRDAADEKMREKAARSGVELVSSESAGKGTKDRRSWYTFSCPKHGLFRSLGARGEAVKCPKCHRPQNFAPTHPNSVPKRLRNKACLLYLITIRDCAGIWTKVGVSTNWECRKNRMAKAGVEVLSVVRQHRTTLYEATKLEWNLKSWMRKTLGRRPCPRVKWSGWSECARDPFRKFPAAFDKAVRDSA